MKIVQKKVHGTDLKRPRASGPKQRSEEAYLVGFVERDCFVIVLKGVFFPID